MKANMDLMEQEQETEHGAVRLHFNIPKAQGKKNEKTRRETVYKWLAILFAFITFAGIAYLFGISDSFSVGEQAERKDYRAEELQNRKTAQHEREKLKDENAIMYANEAVSQEEKTEVKCEPEEELVSDEPVSMPEVKEEEPDGEEF